MVNYHSLRVRLVISVSRHLQFLYWRLRRPELSDFVDMGLGIEARASRCADAWRPHFEAVHALEQAAIARVAGMPSLAVLGAGRLLDLAADIPGRVSRMDLYDLDPSARRGAIVKCRRCPEVKFHLLDLSGGVLTWKRALGKLICQKPTPDPEYLSQQLDAFEISPPSLVERADVLFSLNVLGQIPLYWRDAAAAMLERACGVELDEHGDLPIPWYAPIARGMQRLQRAHLSSLNASGAALVLLISDERFEYHRDGRVLLSEDAVLEPIEPGLGAYRVIERRSWDWELAPQDLEGAEFGVRHRMTGLLFERR